MRHTQRHTFKAVILVLSALLVGSVGPARAQEAERVVLRFDDEMSAIINARCWDETRQQWLGKSDEMFFDAVHRFLLLRFPGCADEIHRKLVEGYEIESAKLVLHWDKQEFRRVADYSWRAYKLEDKEPPKWHAEVWLLKRPWTDDPEIGPTWNAYINGAGYWREGGARSEFYDRLAGPLGRAGLWEEQPRAEIDLIQALTPPEPGDSMGERLRALEAYGFLIKKAELYNRDCPVLGTGVARMWITEPQLVVTLRKSKGRARAGTLPPQIDVRAVAAELRAKGEGGLPTTRIPANLGKLAREAGGKPADMPEWMWQRVNEVRRVKSDRYRPGDPGGGHPEYVMYDQLESGDLKEYLSVMQMILSKPPGWFMGHSHTLFLIPLLDYDEMLLDVVGYHLRKFFQARWEPPYDPATFRHRVGYFGGMGTLNHQSQCRSEAILAGQVLGLSDLVVNAEYALSLLNRQMIYSEGACQEHGDSFYLGITLVPLQALARYSSDPLTRLKASLAVEKLLLEINSTYHPGLRRRVSSISRRYELRNLIMGQDVPRGALHTLSKNGVLIERDKLKVHDIFVNNFHSFPPVSVALVAPWGREWESNAVDEKPLPFTAITTDYVRKLLDEPAYNVTYMGRNYALASRNMDHGKEWPVHAAWRRHNRTVEKLEDLGIMFLWGYVNDTPANRVHQVERAVRMNMGTPLLQHRNKLVYVMMLPPVEKYDTRWEDPYVASYFRKGLKNLYSRVSIYAFGPERERELRVNGRRVDTFPHMARHGDLITLREGVSYVGLIPLPATDLGRRHEVVINYTHPHLTLDSYVADWEQARDLTEQEWRALRAATAGWAVEMGDVDEYGSFDAFHEHMRAARLRGDWAPDKELLHVSYRSGEDTLELGVRPTVEHGGTFGTVPPSAVIAYQRVNGQWPWPDRGIDLDCPLAQMGKGARLEKGGAVLETVEGQMALLRVEPISGTYEGVNPFIDPTPFKLVTPEGVELRSEGELGCGRITVRPEGKMLWVDYRLPPPEGDRGVELLQEKAGVGKRGGGEAESYLSRYFRQDVDVRRARENSARALLVSGFGHPPEVILNGERLEGPFARFLKDGRIWFRIPIVREKRHGPSDAGE